MHPRMSEETARGDLIANPYRYIPFTYPVILVDAVQQFGSTAEKYCVRPPSQVLWLSIL
jgi:hypothetical protein